MFTSVAFSCKLLSKYVLSFTADYLKHKKILSPTTSCKIFQSAGTVFFLRGLRLRPRNSFGIPLHLMTLEENQTIKKPKNYFYFHISASFGVAAVFLLLALYIDCTKQYEALIILAFYGIFSASACPGYFTSSCSFAPMYTGMVSSILECAGGIGHFLATMLVGFIVKNVIIFFLEISKLFKKFEMK